MLERLILRDFQAHRELKLKLAPVTCLVGKSDAGKSAVIRALRWVAENRPAGEAFIRGGAPATSVAVRAGGHWAERRRGNGENVYLLDGAEFAAPRTEVPAPIAALLNTNPINFQGQFDAPFLLAETPGNAAAALNAVVNLGEIDAALARAAADIRRRKSASDAAQAAHNDATARLAALDWVPAMLAAAANLNALETAAAESHQHWESLAIVLDELNAAERILNELGGAADAGAELVSLYDAAYAAEQDRCGLSGLLADLESFETDAAINPAADWAALLELRTTADQIAEERRMLEFAAGDLKKNEAEICQLDAELAAANAELAEMMGGKCPYCGNPATPDSLAQFLCPTSTSATDPRRDAARQPLRPGTKPRQST